jgi:hypothetical protein
MVVSNGGVRTELFPVLSFVLPIFAIVKADLEVGWVIRCTTSSISWSKVEVLDLQVDGFVVPRIGSELRSFASQGITK